TSAAAPATTISLNRSPPARRRWRRPEARHVWNDGFRRTRSMYEFKFSRPATVRQAANLLAKSEDAKIIAGGHTLVPVMKQRLARPAQLIDLSKVEGLDTIEMKGRSLVIGAMARHFNVATSEVVKANLPALA